METTKATRGIIVTVCNFDIYQDSKNYEGNNEGNTKETRRKRGGNTINKNDKNKEKRNNKYMHFKPEWFSEKDWNDVVDHRQQKKAAMTERAFSIFVKEIEIAKKLGYPVSQCVDVMISKGWRGFEARWLQNSNDEIRPVSSDYDPEYEAARQKLVDQGLL